jgi:hypothetical protein
VHDGELPSDIEFVENFGNHRPTYRLSGYHGTADFACHSDKLVLNYDWIPLLIDVVSKPFCNRDLFGIIEQELLPIDSELDESFFKETLRSTGGLSTPPTVNSLFHILKSITKELTPALINPSNDKELNLLFIRLVQSGKIVGGAFIGLAADKLMVWQGGLTATGIAVLREISKNYKLK